MSMPSTRRRRRRNSPSPISTTTTTTGVLLLLSLASLTTATKTPLFSFPDCVDSCILATGCELDDFRCMCKSASQGFLDSVVRCMFRTSCTTSRTASAHDIFIDIVDDGCAALGLTISKDAIRAAETLAASLLAASRTSTGGTTLSTQKTKGSTSRGSGATTTVGSGGGGSSTTRSLTLQSPTTTQIAGGEDEDNLTRTRTQQTPSQTSISTSTPEAARPPPTEPTDSSPFATPIGAAGRTLAVAPVCWVLLAFAIGFAILLR